MLNLFVVVVNSPFLRHIKALGERFVQPGSLRNSAEAALGEPLVHPGSFGSLTWVNGSFTLVHPHALGERDADPG